MLVSSLTTDTKSSLEVQEVRVGWSDNTQVVETSDIWHVRLELINFILRGDHHELCTLSQHTSDPATTKQNKKEEDTKKIKLLKPVFTYLPALPEESDNHIWHNIQEHIEGIVSLDICQNRTEILACRHLSSIY